MVASKSWDPAFREPVALAAMLCLVGGHFLALSAAYTSSHPMSASALYIAGKFLMGIGVTARATADHLWTTAAPPMDPGGCPNRNLLGASTADAGTFLVLLPAHGIGAGVS